ncbi:MAG: hypothetical protein KF770_18090 [Anaerolineae bacterium]|nr:hypothetical protein [Anaerolineae bacterium]
MISPTSTPIPEQGQVVTVRQRPYVVTEAQASYLPLSPLSLAHRFQHLLTLTSIQDDAMGRLCK